MHSICLSIKALTVEILWPRELPRSATTLNSKFRRIYIGNFSIYIMRHSLVSGFLTVNYPRFRVQVIWCIPQLHSNSCQQPLNLGACPPKHSWKQCICVNWNSFKHVELMVPTKLLELGVFGPWTLGQLFINKHRGSSSRRDSGTYLIDVFYDIHKPGLYHPIFPR